MIIDVDGVFFYVYRTNVKLHLHFSYIGLNDNLWVVRYQTR